MQHCYQPKSHFHHRQRNPEHNQHICSIVTNRPESPDAALCPRIVSRTALTSGDWEVDIDIVFVIVVVDVVVVDIVVVVHCAFLTLCNFKLSQTRW